MRKVIILIMTTLLLTALFACDTEYYEDTDNKAAAQALAEDEGSLFDVSSEDEESFTLQETNIALGKSYSLTGIYIDPNPMYDDPDKTKFTDGVIGTIQDIGYASPIWVGLNWKGEGASNEDDTFYYNTITVDLGKKEKNLSKFTLYAEVCESIIEKLKSISVYVSTDNDIFTNIGDAVESRIIDAQDLTNPHNGIYSYTLNLLNFTEARYVKFKINQVTSWVFASEVEIYQTSGDLADVSYEISYDVSSEGESSLESSEESDYEFVFDIHSIDKIMMADSGMIITSASAYETSSTSWSTLIHCQKIEDNLYIVKSDAIYTVGIMPTINFAPDDIVIAIHSMTSNPKEANNYPNVIQKIASLKVKTGMYFSLDGIDLTEKISTNGTAMVTTSDPRE
ncbi:MAG: hypothetical protein A2Y15_00545 [Clostridiales bacterium GWF2_36_10]|nr:MAG: hypothetical protein A2Y15_00545 [Clostridiales bacterium GWF2_36_10]HAN21720.1 hypothetical protein [Clostridiales bacterium]